MGSPAVHVAVFTPGPVGPGYAATSSTSLSTGTGSKTFVTQSGLAYTAGARVRATSTGSGDYMEGLVTSYSGTSLAVNMTRNVGTGTHADWTLNLTGDVGATGATGSAGATGSTGATGAAGYSPLYIVASGVPGSGVGSNGDMYINSANGDVYGPKAAGAWPGSPACNIKGPTGTAGADGTDGAPGIAYTPMGAYAAGTTYAQGDEVSDAGLLYVSLVSSNTGHTPASSPTYWQPLAGVGSQWTTAGSDIVFTGGKVGIGGAPDWTLNVVGDGNYGVIAATTYSSGGQAGVLMTRGANGTKAAPSALLSGDAFSRVQYRGYGATGWGGASVGMIATATENWTDTAQGAKAVFSTTPNGTVTSASVLTLGQDGNVGVGVGTPLYTAAGFRSVAVRGTTGIGIIELSTGAADGDGVPQGTFLWSDTNSSISDKRLAGIGARTEGGTAANRGGVIILSTKADGVSGLTERARVNIDGIGVGGPASAAIPPNSQIWITGKGTTHATNLAGRVSVGLDDNPDYGAYIGTLYPSAGIAKTIIGLRNAGTDHHAITIDNTGAVTIPNLVGGGSPAQFSSYAGTVSGAIDGENAVFTLSSSPVSVINVFVDSARLVIGLHFTWTPGTAVVTFLPGYIPQTGQVIAVEGW